MAGKKGGLELSMGGLIVIIVAITLLIAVIMALTRFSYGGAEAGCSGTSSILSDIFEAAGITDSSTVCNVG